MIPSTVREEIRQLVASNTRPGDTDDSNIEVEVRFGEFDRQNRFHSGVTGRTFARLREKASKLQPAVYVEETKDDYYEGIDGRFTTVFDSSHNIIDNYRLIKSSIKSIDFPQSFFRIGVSREDKSKALVPPGSKIKLSRTKKRWSFLLSNEEFRLDLTEVTSFKPPNYRDGETIYEIELEMLKVDQLDKLSTITTVILQTLVNTYIPYGAQEKQDLIADLNIYLGSTHPEPRGVDIYTLAQVRNLKFHDMVGGGLLPDKSTDTSYSVTIKADGIRRLLVIDKNGVYLVYPAADVNKIFDKTISDLIPQWHGTVLEGEMIPTENLSEDAPEDYRQAKLRFHIYDCLTVAKDGSVRNLPHPSRMEYAEKLVTVFSNQRDSGYIITTKEFLYFQDRDNFYSKVQSVLDDKYPFKTDGVIFTPNNRKYDPTLHKAPDLTRYPAIVKWKPPERITIDFAVRHRIGGIVELQVVDRGYNVPFVGTSRNPFDSTTGVEMDDFIKFVPDGSIVEFEYRDGKFKGLLQRYDKLKPNSLTVAIDDWIDIHDPITEKVLRGQEFKLVFKEHNRLKRKLFKYVSVRRSKKNTFTLLDIGSGRGGDVAKWKEAGFTHIICVEPNPEHIEELKRRFEVLDPQGTMQYTILQTVGQDYSAIIQRVNEFSPTKKVDVISFMLSLSFFFSSDNDIRIIGEIVKHTLISKGYFIAFTIDGQPVMEKLNSINGIIQGDYLVKQLPFTMITFGYYKNQEGERIYIDIPDSIVTQQTEFITRLDKLHVVLESAELMRVDKAPANTQPFLTREEETFSNFYTSLIYTTKK